MGLGTRIQHAWNAFRNNKDPTYEQNIGAGYIYRPDRPRLTCGNDRSIVTALYNRIALDVADLDIRHVRLDDNGRYIDDMKTGLNNCLTIEANLDQTARDYKRDLVLSMLDEGVVASVPIDTTLDPTVTDSYDITTMRTGKILEWYPKHVKVRVYNEKTGHKEDKIVPKKIVAIMENPFYPVFNEPNSTLKRLIAKLNLLDAIDNQSGSGKLDLIMQLPYTIRNTNREVQAEKRLKSIENQLYNSKYGIAYIDSTEKITQLNRPVENNLLKQIEYLTNMLYSQIGMTQSILDGTADEQTMLNYYNKTINPIVSTIVDSMKRTYLTKTARSQRQSIVFFRDPFKLVPVNQIADIADKFTRNEILSSNEVRDIIGRKPSDDPAADELRNKNLNQSTEEKAADDQTQVKSTESEDTAILNKIEGGNSK